ncbi:pentapeptide repeat-containing protein [Nocardia sp. BMG51109]|uniref:pentapeptide repeat-containing protein n=1 Tax=Nocardia sp. BMG51109 TaxID=1056816 RepID=UPI000A04C00B|nr:pentapeptide repeat-containing protein [Nocardia sp. BMG51109]
MLGRTSRATGTETRPTTAVRAGVSKRYRTIGRSVGRVRLFSAVGFALGAGLAVAIAAYGILRAVLPASEAKAAPIDITRVALTIVAGVGGIVALVIAYRRQRDIEQGRFVERFGAAAGQLGTADVAVRIAGVYAMATAADDSEGSRRQQCIDVLCGYLRLPYDPGHGSSGRAKLVTTTPREGGGETEEHVEYRQNDREVRRTIVRVIADHLQPEAEYSWSTSNFDFRTAHLEEVAFRGAVFSGLARFDTATFDGPAGFERTTFHGPAGFEGTTFNGHVGFDGAVFHGPVRFDETVFNDGAKFQEAAFKDDAGFYRVTFNGHARFHWATFNGAEFYRATFNGHARFDHATFHRGAVFRGATFNGHSGFRNVTFSDAAGFGKTTFSGHAEFDQAAFVEAQFSEAVFNGPAGFIGARFNGPATFANADFGSERIVFEAPARWGPPDPEFDWDQDITEKPANIEPQSWPPATTTAKPTMGSGNGP